MSNSARSRVAVIGGGISGLAAAHQLRQLDSNLDVELFEAGPRLGGVIQTTERNGFLIEGAADNFITTTASALQLCNDLGLGDELIQTNPRGAGAMVVCRGKLEPIPPGFMIMAPSRIWPLLATKILSPMGKLRSGMEVFVPRKQGSEDESLRSFTCRRFGSELFERLVQPLVGGIYTADPARLSVAATMPRFLEMERKHGSLIRGMLAARKTQESGAEKGGGARYSQFMTLQGGMSKLIAALAENLSAERIHLNSPVRKLIQGKSAWKIVTSDRVTETDAIIVAAPADHAARMLCHIDAEIARQLEKIEYASCAVVSLAFHRDQIQSPINSFGFVVPAIEERCILSCSFSSEKYEGRAPRDTVLMRVFIGGAMQPGLLCLSNQQLIELAHREVAQLLDITGEPILRHVTRQDHAMPQYHVGHKSIIANIHDRLDAFPTLTLAGSCLSGVGVPRCIESGQKAARRIAESLASDKPLQESRVHRHDLSASA